MNINKFEDFAKVYALVVVLFLGLIAASAAVVWVAVNWPNALIVASGISALAVLIYALRRKVERIK